MEPVLANVTIRRRSHRCDDQVSPVPGGCSNPCWRPHCVRMCDCTTYRQRRYEPVGEGTVRGVVCRNDIGYKDVSEQHIIGCHDRKRRYVFGTYEKFGKAGKLLSRTFTHTRTQCAGKQNYEHPQVASQSSWILFRRPRTNNASITSHIAVIRKWNCNGNLCTLNTVSWIHTINFLKQQVDWKN